MAGWIIIILILQMPALPEKMAGEWLPRPAAYRPAGIQKIIQLHLEYRGETYKYN